MRLVYDKSGNEVKIGDRVTTFRGEEVEVVGITKPHSPASTGRVTVRDVADGWQQEFYPGVIDATWVDREDRN